MRERRNNFRVEWNSAARIYDCDGHFTALCIVSNFSNGGAKIVGLEPGTVPDEFILRISPRTRAQRCQVVRRSRDGLGVKFTDSAKSTGELVVNGQQKSLSKRSERYPQWA
jgi:PilZ domain